MCFIKIIHIYIIYCISLFTSWSKSISEYAYSFAFCRLSQKHGSKYSSLKIFIFLLAYMSSKCKYQEVLFKDIICFSTNAYDSQKCYCIFWKKTGPDLRKLFCNTNHAEKCLIIVLTFMKTFEESAVVTMAVLWQK